MARIALRPLDTEAVQQANNDFYNNHPKMVDKDGKRIPIDDCDHNQIGYQTEWMDSYVKYGGKWKRGTPDAKCGQPVMPCPRKATLIVQVRDEEGKAVERTHVTLDSASMQITGPDGTVQWDDLEPQGYTVTIDNPDFYIDVPSQAGALSAGGKEVVTFHVVSKKKMKKVAAKWFLADCRFEGIGPGIRGGQWVYRDFYTSIIEKYTYVPVDHFLLDDCRVPLEVRDAGLETTWLLYRCTGKYGKDVSSKYNVPNVVRALRAPDGGEFHFLRHEKYGLDYKYYTEHDVYESWDRAEREASPEDYAIWKKWRE